MTFDHENPVTAVDWSPNDQKIVTAAGDEIYVWEVNRRALGRTLTACRRRDDGCLER